VKENGVPKTTGMCNKEESCGGGSDGGGETRTWGGKLVSPRPGRRAGRGTGSRWGRAPVQPGKGKGIRTTNNAGDSLSRF
jgi:hypothetical protein